MALNIALSEFVLTPACPPGKKNQFGLDAPTSGLTLPARKEILSREATALNAKKIFVKAPPPHVPTLSEFV